MGKYVLSTVRNSGAQNWSPSKGTRFKDSELRDAVNHPPPGTYNPSDRDSSNGNYILSNFKTLGIKRFHPKINNANDSLYARKFAGTPGPGTYIARSDFGTLTSTKGS